MARFVQYRSEQRPPTLCALCDVVRGARHECVHARPPPQGSTGQGCDRSLGIEATPSENEGAARHRTQSGRCGRLVPASLAAPRRNSGSPIDSGATSTTCALNCYAHGAPWEDTTATSTSSDTPMSSVGCPYMLNRRGHDHASSHDLLWPLRIVWDSQGASEGTRPLCRPTIYCGPYESYGDHPGPRRERDQCVISTISCCLYESCGDLRELYRISVDTTGVATLA